jgi:hypothetical protein
MFNKKKKNDGVRPDYRTYKRDATGFKRFIADMIEFLRSEGNKHAKAFDIDGFLRLAPDDLTPDGVLEHPELHPYIGELIENMGWDVFGDMFTRMGLSKSVIDAVSGDGFDALNKTGKDIPGLNGDKTNKSKERANAIYQTILGRMADKIIEATSKNDPSVLDETIESLTKVQEQTADLPVSVEARENIQHLLESTVCFRELIDEEQTTPEEYNSFLNNVISHFIADQIDDTNHEVDGKHSDHDPEECELTAFAGHGPLKIVYRRFFGADDDEPAIPGLLLLVLDTVRGVVHPISISLHEALCPIAEKRFNGDCRSEAGTEFIGSNVVQFIKDNEELVKAMVSKHDVDEDGAQAAMLRVSPEVVSPTAQTMREALAEMRASFNVDAREVFGDLKPEDFFK